MPIFLLIRTFLKGIPWQMYCIFAIVALCVVSYFKGRHDMKNLWEADVERLKIEAQQMLAENERQNRLIQEKQKLDSKKVTEKYNAEINSLKSSNFKLSGMLLGPNVCDEPSSAGETPSTDGGARARITPRILSAKGAGVLEELVAQAEHDAAVARACQAFVRLNEFPIEEK